MEPVYSPPDVFHAKYRPDWWPAVSPTQIVSQLTKREHLLIYKNAMNALVRLQVLLFPFLIFH